MYICSIAFPYNCSFEPCKQGHRNTIYCPGMPLFCLVILVFITTTGTDDDLPPSHPTRVPIRGNIAGNGRSIVGSYSRMHSDMEAQIHLLEQEAYCAVLRAFKAQSDAITWV